MSRTNKKQSKSHGNIRSIISILVSVVLTGAALLLWVNRQYVLDWISYQEYTPSAAVQQLAERTTMNGDGLFYFYASKPEVQNATAFNKSCDRKESGSAILGCYANNRVYVYDITNEQLDGIKEVTAAHEMLHAVYQRLSDTEKQRINQLLKAEYEKIKDDEDLSKRMEFYAKYEAGEEYNELHSIIATEFKSLDPELEKHYARYFENRSAVFELYDKYAEVFRSLQEKSEALLAQLKSLGPQIEAASDTYNAAVQRLNADIQSFNARATGGAFDSQAAFNSERSRLVSRADALDAQRAQINRNLETYEKIRQEYNATAATSNDLYKSMDSKLDPTPSV